MMGAPGTTFGVTAFDGAEGAPVPTALVAVTVKVYVVPLVRAVTRIAEAVPVAVTPPGLEVTVYLVIGEPPSLAGGEKATVAWASPGDAGPMVGAPGAVVATVTGTATENQLVLPAGSVAVEVIRSPTAPAYGKLTLQGVLHVPGKGD